MKKNNSIFPFLLIGLFCIPFAVCIFSSCGKTNTVLPAASNVQYQVLNLSPDLLPIDLYIDQTKKNTALSFSYPNATGYFSLTSVDTPFQIRSSSVVVSTTNIFSIDTILKNNLKYSLFVTGLRANNSLTYILTRDTAAVPTAGRGKIRFVNASVNGGPFDITANGTAAFSNQAFKNVSKFIEFPVGNYDFKAFPTGSTSTVLYDLPNVTIKDGKIYTLYCQGVVGRTDSAAFTLAMFQSN